MKFSKIAGWILVATLGFVCGARAESTWFAEGTGGVWVSPDLDDFTVYQGGWAERADGNNSFIANLKAGMEFEEPDLLVDFAGVGGFYGNGAVAGLQMGSEASIRYKFGEQKGSWTVGPHAGFNLYTAQWVGSLDNAVDFDPAFGATLGVKATVGSEKMRLVITIDYVSVEFDVDNNDGFANNDKLDMSGVVAQVGLQF